MHGVALTSLVCHVSNVNNDLLSIELTSSGTMHVIRSWFDAGTSNARRSLTIDAVGLVGYSVLSQQLPDLPAASMNCDVGISVDICGVLSVGKNLAFTQRMTGSGESLLDGISRLLGMSRSDDLDLDRSNSCAEPARISHSFSQLELSMTLAPRWAASKIGRVFSSGFKVFVPAIEYDVHVAASRDGTKATQFIDFPALSLNMLWEHRTQTLAPLSNFR